MHVSVSAFPAVKLLFGYADRVTVRVGTLSSGQGSADGLLASAARVGSVDGSAGELQADGLVLTHVSLTKRGNRLTGRAQVTRSAIAAVLPIDLRLARASARLRGIDLLASVNAFGKNVSAEASVEAVNGDIEIEPDIPILGDVSALSVTVFNDPLVRVDSVSAVQHGQSYALTVTAHYR